MATVDDSNIDLPEIEYNRDGTPYVPSKTTPAGQYNSPGESSTSFIDRLGSMLGVGNVGGNSDTAAPSSAPDASALGNTGSEAATAPSGDNRSISEKAQDAIDASSNAAWGSPEGDLAAQGAVDPSDAIPMSRGAVKGVVSGVPELYGIMGATVDYAANHAAGGNTQFSDQLFKPGGMDAIRQDGQQFVQQYQASNPNATTGEVAQAYQNYRATPQYYNFAADQMRSGLSQGMRNAMAVNQVYGDQRTPDAEDAKTQALENVGSFLLPLPGSGSIIGAAKNIATRIAGKVVGNAAGHIAGLAVPGAQGPTAAALGVVASQALPAIAEARSHHSAAILSRGMIDPRNGQVVTSPASMSDPIEAAHSGPALTPQESAGTSTQTDSVQPPNPQVVGAMPPQASGPVQAPAPPLGKPAQQPQSAPTKPGVPPAAPAPQGIAPQLPSQSKVAMPQTIDQSVGPFAGATPGIPGGAVGMGLTALGVATAAYGAIKFGGKAIERLAGRTPVNVDAFAGEQHAGGTVAPAVGRQENITNSVNIRGNLANPQTSNSLPLRVLRAFDKAVNKDAPVEDQARDLGGDPLERIIQAQLGTKLSPGAKAADKARVMHHGLLPDGSAMQVVPEDFFTTAGRLSQDQRNLFTQLIQGLNIRDRREAGMNQLLNREQELVRTIRTARSQRPALMQELADTRGLIQLRSADDPQSRITFGQVPDTVLDARILAARQDPDVRNLETMFRSISHDLSQFEYNSGTLTSGDLVQRLRDTHYQPLFEFEYKGKQDVRANNDLRDTTMPDAAPERAIDPFSAVAFKVSNAVDNANTNVAITRIVNAFRSSDPSSRVVREVGQLGHNGGPPMDQFGVVTIYENGEPRYFQFARPAVADALKSQSLDVGPILNAANKMRTVFQQYVTGPIFGTLYTPIRSVMFDGLATQATHRSGRAFGVASYVAQRAAINRPALQRFADLVGAVDPTGPTAVTAYGFANASLMHMYGAASRKIEQMAVTQSPVFAALGNIPGGQQQLQALGARMAHAYDSSMVHILEQNNGVHVHQMIRDTLLVRNELEGFMRSYQNAGRGSNDFTRSTVDPTVSTLRTLYHGYTGILNTIHNASRYGYAAQNLSLLNARAAARGSAVTPDEIRTLAEEVRRSAGDLAGQPGSKGLKQFEAATPYANISFQSARHVLKAMQRDPMQVGLTMIGLAGATYATQKLIASRGPEAEKWFWDHANPWERIGAIRIIPKIETMWYMAQHGGALPPWNPHDPMGDFYEISVAPELMPYITMLNAGLEQLGLIKRPNDATSITKDMGFALADSLAVGTQPLLNVPMIALTGHTLNFTAGASGRSIIQGPQVGQGIGANAGKPNSGLPSIAPQIMQALFGLAGTTAYSMVDQGVQAYKDGQSYADVTRRVGLELEEYAKERPAVPDIPLLYNAPAKVYRSTPASRRMQDLYSLVRGELGSGRGLDAAWSMEFGKASERPDAATAPHVMDMQVLEMMADVHNAYLRKGAIKDEADTANDMKKDANNYSRQKAKTPIADISSGKFRYGLQSLLLNWQLQEDKTLAAAEDFNKQLADKYGDRFRQEGVSPTVEGVAKLVQKYARPLNPGESPLAGQVGRGPKHSLVFPGSTAPVQ